jgi:hypothetical protein
MGRRACDIHGHIGSNIVQMPLIIDRKLIGDDGQGGLAHSVVTKVCDHRSCAVSCTAVNQSQQEA